MKKLITINLIALLLSACAATPKLPDPTIKFPAPPAVLMEPPKEMQPISP